MHPASGGPPVVADRFCRALHGLGWEVEVISTNGFETPGDDSWIEKYQAPYQMTIFPLKGPKGFGYCRELKQSLEEKLQNTDIVHIHNLWSYFNIQGSKLCRKLNRPFVVSTHGMLDPNSLGRKSLKKKVYGNLIEWPALRTASGMIYTHPEECRLAEQQCSGLPQGHVIPLASDEAPSEDRDELSKPFFDRFPQFKSTKNIIFFGRLHSKKGLDLLIPAMAAVKKNHPAAKLLLVGPCEPSYRTELDSKAAEHGVSDVCEFLGPLHDEYKWGALAAANLFALPSYQENFAIALVEALRVGTPAVISKRVNIWNDLSNANAAKIVELDVESVGDTISECLDDLSQLRQIGNNGSKFAKETYSWERSGQMLDVVYRKIIDGR